MSHVAEFASSDEDIHETFDLGPYGPMPDDEECGGCGAPHDFCVCDDAYDSDEYDHTDPYAGGGWMDAWHAQYDG